MVTHHAIRSSDATMRVPGHGAGNINQKHCFEVVRTMKNAVCEFMKSLGTGRVDFVWDLSGVFMVLNLFVALEDVAGALVSRQFVLIKFDLASVSFIASSYYCVSISKNIQRSHGRVFRSIGCYAIVEEIV